MLSRTSFRFSARGTHVACLMAPRTGSWCVESWRLLPEPSHPHVHQDLAVRGPSSQVLALDDGRVLVCQPLPSGAGGHELTLAEPTGSASTLATTTTLGLRILEHPRRDVLAVAVTTESTPELSSTLWLVRDATPALEPVCTVSGLLAGGSWLDPAGARLGLNQAHQGALTAVVADLGAATVTPLWPEHLDVRLLFALPGTGRLVVGDEEGAIGWTAPGDALHWSRTLDGSIAAFPIAADPAGDRVAMRVEYGARSGLALYSPVSDRVDDLRLPMGTVGATASWVEDTLRVPFASSDQPACLIELCPDAVRPQAAQEPAAEARPDRGSDLHLESFTGPAGPVEAVVHGDWRDAAEVVVALHGGPDSSWRLDHGPLLAELAGADTAVVAVNPRGSHGYRGAHEALRAGWGGADLADVQAVASAVTSHRNAPVHLFGVSYGAFLALLALATRPEWWARAAVVAPFLSGPRLYADGGARVRTLLDRLGGHTVYTDESGARDLTQLAEHITAPLLLMHGAADEVIPVSHSRELADRLRAAGAPVDYIELADAGHDPFTGPAARSALTRIRDFLADAAAGAPARPSATTDRVVVGS